MTQPWTECATVADLRAALEGYPPDTEIVQEDGDPILIIGEAPEPATDIHEAVPAYLSMSAWLADRLDADARVAPRDLCDRHIGPRPEPVRDRDCDDDYWGA